MTTCLEWCRSCCSHCWGAAYAPLYWPCYSDLATSCHRAGRAQGLATGWAASARFSTRSLVLVWATCAWQTATPREKTQVSSGEGVGNFAELNCLLPFHRFAEFGNHLSFWSALTANCYSLGRERIREHDWSLWAPSLQTLPLPLHWQDKGITVISQL